MTASRNASGDRFHADDQLRQRLRHARDGQHPCERARHRDDDQHRRGHERRASEDRRQHRPRQRPIDERSRKQRVEHGDDACLGRREDPERDAAEDDRRQHQRRQRAPRVAQVILQRQVLDQPAIVASHRDHVIDRRHATGDRNARHHARDHQPDEVDLRIHERIDDHADRRRNDRAEDRHRRRQRGRVLGEIAVLAHHADHDCAGAGRIGERRAADARRRT